MTQKSHKFTGGVYESRKQASQLQPINPERCCLTAALNCYPQSHWDSSLIDTFAGKAESVCDYTSTSNLTAATTAFGGVGTLGRGVGGLQ